MRVNKLFVILIVFLLNLMFFSCTNNKITINYVTNGGNNITSDVISTSDISLYTLPPDPVQDGFTFLGWFTDKECTVPFENLSQSVTLYAKWEKIKENKSIDLDFNTYFKLEPDLIDLDASLKYYIQDPNPKSLYDLELLIDITLKEKKNVFVNEEVLDLFNNFRLMIYIKNCKIYFSVPGNLLPLLDVKLGNIYASIDLFSLYDYLLDNLGEKFYHYFPRLTSKDVYYNNNLDDLYDTIKSELNKYLLMLNVFDYSTDDFNLLLDIFKSLFTNLSNVTSLDSLERKEEVIRNTLISFTDAIYSYYKDHGYKLHELVTTNIFLNDEVVSLTEYDGCYFISELPYYFDQDLKIHNYSEDTTEKYGIINSSGYYIPNYSHHYIFNTNNNFEEIKLVNYKTYTIDGNNENVYFTFDGKYFITESGDKKDIKLLNDYIKQDAFTHYKDYYEINGYYYNYDYELLSDKELFEKLYSDLSKNIYDNIMNLLKNNFHFNDLLLGDNFKISLNLGFNDENYQMLIDGAYKVTIESEYVVNINTKYFIDVTNKLADIFIDELEYVLDNY